MARAYVLLSLLAACGGDVKAPVPIGFSGKCELVVPRESVGSFQSADQAKSRVELRIAKDMLTAVHVEVPDNRHAKIEELPDHALVTGDASPNVLVDRGGDLEVPMQLRGSQEPWDDVVHVRFRDDHAEVVAGLMVLSGPCEVDPKAQ